MIAGGCRHCGGTAGNATVPGEPESHAVCHYKALAGLPTPSLGDICPCCEGSGCHPRSATGPINPTQDQIERWAPACMKCKGSGSINVAEPNYQRHIEENAAKKRHWFEGCQIPS